MRNIPFNPTWKPYEIWLTPNNSTDSPWNHTKILWNPIKSPWTSNQDPVNVKKKNNFCWWKNTMFEQPPVHHRFQGLESTCRSRWQPATVWTWWNRHGDFTNKNGGISHGFNWMFKCFASWDLTIKHGENGRGAALCRTSKQGTAENVNPEWQNSAAGRIA